MNKILSVKRHELIMDILTKEKSLKLNDIIEKLGISEATARRDLVILEKEGRLIRIHGGAILLEEDTTEKDIFTKNQIFIAQKHKIAKTAASFVKNGDLIFLDAGSTTEILIQYLSTFKDIQVVTNGFTHIQKLLTYKINTTILGGNLKAKTGAVVGSAACLNLKFYNFNIAFIGCNSVTSNGFSTPDIDEVVVKSEAVSRAKKVYFLSDSSKLGQEETIIFAKLDDGILITEDGLIDNKYIKENY